MPSLSRETTIGLIWLVIVVVWSSALPVSGGLLATGRAAAAAERRRLAMLPA